MSCPETGEQNAREQDRAPSHSFAGPAGWRAAPPFAKALFELAKDRAAAELIGRELDNAAATFAGLAELCGFSARPWIPATVKRAVVTEIAQRSGLSKLTTDFLALVAGRDRIDHLKVIAEKYQKRLDEDLGWP
jgi:F0F1-type ATP synthase delta subunit